MKELEKYIIDEKTGLKYELVGDYYYPCLEAPEAPKVGRFGMLYHDYLRNNKRVTYSGLMLSGKLKEHIEDIDRQAEEIFSQLVDQMKQAEGISEELKATDQMEWVRRMNSIRGRAEEIVLNKLIYA
ncbi:MAG: TnpV protein [Clostridia bacterium]|nr:TnpV protein [Clostridia bacterium]